MAYLLLVHLVESLLLIYQTGFLPNLPYLITMFLHLHRMYYHPFHSSLDYLHR